MTAASPLDRLSVHAIRDNVLGPDDLADLLAFTLAHRADFASTKIGSAGVSPDFRASRALPRRMFDSWRKRIEGYVTALLPARTRRA